MTPSIIYLASPYTDPSPRIRQLRYELAREAVAHLLRHRTAVYSPIVHCHDLAIQHDLPHDAQFWQWYNFTMMEVCRALFVLELPGVRQSEGVAGEMEEAARSLKPIAYIPPTEWGLNESKLQELASGLSGVHSAIGGS